MGRTKTQGAVGRIEKRERKDIRLLVVKAPSGLESTKSNLEITKKIEKKKYDL